MINHFDVDTIYVHLPTGQRGRIHWETGREWGAFLSYSGTEFTVSNTEVISLEELETA